MADLKFKNAAQNFVDNIFASGKIRLIEASDDDKRILKELGIKFPNPDLALFEGVYLLADKANRNRHYLSSDTVSKAVSSIKMKPVNYFHKRGQPIGVYINGTFNAPTKAMRTVGVLWRSLFPERVTEIEKLIKSENSGQSFELTYQKSEARKDTSIELFDITFKGGAILPRDKAACRDTSADVLAKMQESNVVMGGLNIEGEEKMADEKKKEVIAEEEILSILDKEDTSKEDVEKQTEALHVWEEKEVEYEAEAKKLTYKQRKELPDDAFAYIKTIKGRKVRRFPIHDKAHVKSALVWLPQAKKLSSAEKTTIKQVILRTARQLGMASLLKKHKDEICFNYDDILDVQAKIKETYKDHISPDKLEDILAEKLEKALSDKAKFAERRESLTEFADVDLEAYDILNDEVFDKLSKDNQIKALQKNVTDLDWLKERIKQIEQAAFQCSCTKCGHKVTTEEHCNTIKCPKCGGEMRRANRPGTGRPDLSPNAEIAKGAEDNKDNKVDTKDGTKDTKVDKEEEKPIEKKDDKPIEKKADEKPIEKKEEKPAEKKDEKPVDKKAEEKPADKTVPDDKKSEKKEDTEGKLLIHGMPKVIDESVKEQMRNVYKKRGDK